MTKASARKRAEALALLRAALALAALQLLCALVEWAARPWLGERGAQAAAMAALLAVGLALLRGRIRALLPARFRRGDVLAACAAAALYATAPANYLEGAPAVANLLYGSILTPAAEDCGGGSGRCGRQGRRGAGLRRAARGDPAQDGQRLGRVSRARGLQSV